MKGRGVPKLAPIEVKAILQNEKAAALAAVTASTLVQERARALDYYNGKMSNDMPTLDGRSGAVSLDVADTVEGLMPSLLEIFAGSEEVVKFDPVGPEDVEAAQQETDYVNHVFMQENEGFLVLYTFLKDALLEKVGIVKVWSEENHEEKKESYYDQTDDALALLASDPNVEVIAHTDLGNGLHDIEVQTNKKIVKHYVENIPPEQFGVSRSAKTIRKANYCYHEVLRSESEAIEAGFDATQIKALPTFVLTAWSTGTEAIARDTVNESTQAGSDPGVNEANRTVKITEHYVVMDYEGTGVARRYRVTTGGDQGEILKRNGKLDVEEVENNPFAVWSPIMMPHRFFGKSLADFTIDIQKVKTALIRGILDNLYLHNNARVEVAETYANENTLDDLLVSRPGGIIRTKQPGGLNWQQVPDVTQSIYPALEYMDMTREWRTGVTRQGQGIDASALQNQSATAANQLFTMAQARMKLIARVAAETGIRDMFWLLHGTIRKYGDQQQTIMLRNRWVDVNPREWRERNNLTVKVGLGGGSKNEQFAQQMAIGNVQKELVMAGKSNIVDDQKLYNTAASLTRIMGHKAPDEFFNDPSEKDPQTGQLKYPPAPPQPDPKVQVEQMRQQGAMQQNAQQAQLNQQKAQTDAVHQQVKAQTDAALAQFKAELDARLKLFDAHMKGVGQAQDLHHAHQQHQLDVAETMMNMAQQHQKHQQSLEIADRKSKEKPKAKT